MVSLPAIPLVKFFTPDGGWTWYATKYDPVTRVFFGLVKGLETELGTFSLDELHQVRGKPGLPVEQDRCFSPCPCGSYGTMPGYEAHLFLSGLRRGELDIRAYKPPPTSWTCPRPIP